MRHVQDDVLELLGGHCNVVFLLQFKETHKLKEEAWIEVCVNGIELD